MKKIITALVLSISCFSLNAQPTILNEVQIKEDTDLFISALRQAHPGLDIYLNRSEIDSIFNDLGSFKKPLPLKEFYILLLKAVANLGDGHTDLHEGELFQKSYPYLEYTLPFEAKIISGKLYITKDYSEKKKLPLFLEVLSINDILIEESLQRLYLLTPSDGNRLGFKERYNEKIFGRLFPKLFNHSNEYEITFKHPDKAISTYKVKGINDAIIHSNKYDKTPLVFELNKRNNFALLTVNTFQYRLMIEKGIDFHKFLKDSFEKIRKNKINRLILDLRENYGGDNILAIALYSYLTQGTFEAMSPSLTKLGDTIAVSSYSNYPKGNYPFLKTHKVKSLTNLFFELKDGIDSKSNYNSDFIYKGPKNKPENISKNKFAGDVYCITSGLTFSAGANLATLLRRNNNVTFVGQETGGSSGYFCGGGFYSITLPNSKFVLQIPYMKRSVSHSAKHKSGLTPDFLVDKDIRYLQTGQDREMLKVKELLQVLKLKGRQ